jgi:sigma-B regulation protein RsbU (phosphoserine phosphatase)
MKGKAPHRIPYLSRRWRVLIVLLVFSLAPFLVVTILCQRGAARFAKQILHSVEVNLTEIVGKELQQTAKSYGRLLSGGTEILEGDRSVSATTARNLILSRVHKINDLSSQWSPAMQGFLVYSGIAQETGEPTLQIMAKRDLSQEKHSWQPVLESEWLSSPDSKGMASLVNEVRVGKNGYLKMVYGGIECLWAYAPATESLSLVLVLPKEKILAQIQQAHDLLILLTQRQWLVIGAASAVVIVLVILTAFWRSHSMTRPLQVMVEALDRLAGGDFSSRMEFTTGDERDILARAFNEMVPQLEDRIRIRKALEVAQEVQQNLLPLEIPVLPGFDISATAIYCDETGGDYFDFFHCGKDCEYLGVAIGDVSGHGVPAALLMTTARALLRMRSSQPGSTAQVVNSVNRLLTADTYECGRFMTLFYLNLDQKNRRLHWVRAGHEPGIFYDPATDSFEELLGSGIALGVDAEWQYEENERKGLISGQIVFLGTDGIWETRKADGEMFGKQRLYDIIRHNAKNSAKSIEKAVLEKLGDFRGEFDQEDDITMVVIKVK